MILAENNSPLHSSKIPNNNFKSNSLGPFSVLTANKQMRFETFPKLSVVFYSSFI